MKIQHKALVFTHSDTCVNSRSILEYLCMYTERAALVHSCNHKNSHGRTMVVRHVVV